MRRKQPRSCRRGSHGHPLYQCQAEASAEFSYFTVEHCWDFDFLRHPYYLLFVCPIIGCEDAQAD